MGIKGNRHQLNSDYTIYARQSLKATNSGAFQNDIACVGSLDTFFFHEEAFENTLHPDDLTDPRLVAECMEAN